MAYEHIVETINTLECLLKSANVNESTRKHAAAVKELLEKELEVRSRPHTTGE